MTTTPTPVETSTVYVLSNSNEFRTWWNRQYWQTDIRSLRDVDEFHYFGQASSLVQALSSIAITL
jgi:hypothetical protein